MPFQKGNNLGSHGNHARGFKCRNLKQLKDMRWIHKGDVSQRVPSAVLADMLAQGWEHGRLGPSEETRLKQSESQKKRVGRVRALPGARRNTMYKVRYKRTINDFDVKLSEQGDHCALCPSTGAPKRRLGWDHDHNCCPGYTSCGKCVRGLLCIACNKMLGHLEEILKEGTVVARPGTWTELALAYIERYKTPQPEPEQATIFCTVTNKQEPSIVVCSHLIEGEPMADFQAPGEIWEDAPRMKQPGFAFCAKCVDDDNRLDHSSIICYPCFEKVVKEKEMA